MIGKRMTELLKASVALLDQGEPPLSHGFLVEHDVTLDEAYDLADWISRCIGVTLQLDQTAAGQNLMAQHIAFDLVEKELAK